MPEPGPRRRWRRALLFAVAIVNIGLVAALALIARPSGLRATVSATPSPGTGTPSYSAIDSDLSEASLTRFASYAGRQDIVIRWDGLFYATDSREHEFNIIAAGRFDLRVDGHLILSQEATGSHVSASGRIDLRRGPHLVGIVLERPEKDSTFLLRRDEASTHEPVRVPLEELSPVSMSERAWGARRLVTPLVIALLVAWTTLVCLVAWQTIRWVLPATDVLAERSVRAALVFGAVVFGVGLWWSLPGPSWALDEIAPYEVRAGVARHFSAGWHDKYPPFHFFALTLVLAPGLIADALNLIDLSTLWLDAAMYTAQRLLSLAMGVGMLACLAVLADGLIGRRSAWIAVVAAACFMPVAYYAKTTNLDIPYVFWFVLSMVFFASALRDGRRRDFVAFGVAAALAMATKDQAYGLYAAPSLYLAWQQIRHRRVAPLLAGVGAGAIAFALAHNMAFNFAGFQAHVSDALGPGSQPYRMFPATPAGQWALALTTAPLVTWSLGWAGLAATVLGLVVAARRDAPARLPLWLHLPALSYCVTFLAVVGYVYDRFLLPIVVLLALATALGVRHLLDGWPRPMLGRLAAGLVLASLIWRAISLDALLVFDSRYAVETWLRTHVPQGAGVARVQPPSYLPRLAEFRVVQIEPTIPATVRLQPEFIVVNTDFLRRYAPGTGRRVWLSWLESGNGPYVEVLRYRAPMTWSAFRWTKSFQDDVESPTINLDKANAEFVVFQRWR